MEDEAQGYGNGEGKGGSRRATAGGGTAAAAGGSASPSAAAATTAPAASKPTRTHGERWEESFRRLVAFQKKHGHCNIPYRYEEDPFLGRWVSLQRSIYKGEAAAASSAGSSAAAAAAPSASALAQGDTATQRDRIRRLNEIGFEWNPQETRHVSWEQRYGELCDFVARNGHARVPLGWKENIQLSHWVSAQRREYKLLRKGLPSRLTHDRLQKLEKINFLWKAGRGGPRVQPSSDSGQVEPMQHDPATGIPNFVPGAPSVGAAAVAPADLQGANASTLALTANPPPGVAAPSGYTLPAGAAFLLTNAGAFPAILAQPNALAPFQGLIHQQQEHVGGAPADPSQPAANATTAAATAAAAAATVLNLLPLLAQTAATTTATAPAATTMTTGPGPAPTAAEDPSVAALRLLMASGVVAPTVGGTGTGAAQAAPAVSVVLPPAFGPYGASPAPGGAAPAAPGVPTAQAVLDPQAAMNLALTLQLLTRAQAASGLQPPQPGAPANAAEGAGNDPGPGTSER